MIVKPRQSFYWSFLTACFLPFCLQATHIVGGEITYRCLGNNQYEISLTVFRDCDTGVPWFDNPASVGIFDGLTNQLLSERRLSLRNNDTLSLALADPCFVVPPNVCIHTTTYRDTVNLPFRAGGYTLAYQRCCRNQDIINIIDPLSAGATYSVRITEAALNVCNNSPVFRDWPPVYICAGVPILYDHSAIDSDGDSIVYQLCTPQDGAFPSNPMPQPPFNPPYDPVTWFPPFSETNMLGGSDALRINPSTGLLQGTPNILGVFVVGVCAQEYRNGVLLSEIRRDFQYAVGVCGRRVNAAFFAPEIQCDNGLTVRFLNQSQTLGLGYLWDFGDPTTGADSSRLVNPIYVYPDTGRYQIRLVADPGSQCADTSFREVYLQYESLRANFTWSLEECSDRLLVDFRDLSRDSISQILSWRWDFGNGTIANVANPNRVVYDASGRYVVRLDVRAANGCEASYVDSFSYDLPQILSPDTVVICGGGTVVLNPNGNVNHSYQWSPALGLSDAGAVSPLASPSVSTLYRVTVTSVNGGDTCRLERAIWVELPPPISIIGPNDTITCADSVRLEVGGSGLVAWEWSSSPLFDSIWALGNPAFLPVVRGQNRRYFVRGRDVWGCTVVDSFRVWGQNEPIQVNFRFSPLSCDSVYRVLFEDLTQDSSRGALADWFWDFGLGGVRTERNPTVVFGASGTYPIVLRVRSVRGCEGEFRDTLRGLRLPILAGSNLVGICTGQSSVVLNEGGDTSLLYEWSPALGLSDVFAASPVASPSQPTTYRVRIRAVNGLDTCEAEHEVRVVFPSPLVLTAPNQLVYCGDSVRLSAQSSGAVAFRWATNNLFTTIVGRDSVVWVRPSTQPLAGFYVEARDSAGCRATQFVLVERRNTPVNVQFAWSAVSCSDTLLLQLTDLTVDTLGSSVVAWDWFISNGFRSTERNPRVVLRNGGSFFITLNLRLANGCTGSLTRVLSFNLPNLAVGAEQGTCGDSVVILNRGGNPNLQYQWSPISALSAGNVVSPQALPPSLPFTYTVTVTAVNLGLATCTAVRNLTLRPSLPPSVRLDDTSFCRPSHQVLAMVSNNISRLEWALDPSFSQIPVVNANPVFVNFALGQPSDFRLYIRATDNLGCRAVDSAVLRYDTLPIPINLTYQLPNCGADSFVVLYGVQTGANLAGASYQWVFDQGGSSSSLAQPRVVYTDVRNPRLASLTVTLANGCQGRAVDSFSYDFPSLQGPRNLSLCDGGGNLVLNAGGNPNLQYQWSPSTGLSSTTAASPVLSAVGGVGVYVVSITANHQGQACLVVDTVRVAGGGLELNGLRDSLICGGRNIRLDAQPSRPAQITWALDSSFQLILSQNNPFDLNLNVSRVYYVLARDSFGCEARDSFVLNVQPSNLSVDFVAEVLSCRDGVLDLDLSGQLSNPNIAIRDWFWQFGNGQQSSLPQASTQYSGGGTYNIRLEVVDSLGCSAQRVRPLSFSPALVTNWEDSLLFCPNVERILLGAGVNPTGDFRWLPSQGLDNPLGANPWLDLSNAAGSYALELYSWVELNGRRDTCLNRLEVLLRPAVLPQGGLVAAGGLCNNLAALRALDSSQLGFRWADNRDFQAPFLGTGPSWQGRFEGGDWVYLETRSFENCVVLDSLQLFSQSLVIQSNDLVLACLGGVAELQAEAEGNLEGLTWLWLPEEAVLGSNDGPNIEVDASANRSFQVIGRNRFGCVDTALVALEVGTSNPMARAEARPSVVLQGQSTQLSTIFNQDWTYFWSPERDLDQANRFNPVARPQETTWYVVRVRDRFGCEAKDSVEVKSGTGICGEPNIFVPNAFTPDGDGLNDEVFVRGSGITELYFAVYNRWGERVFETRSQNQGWDGRFQGQTLNSDAYGYYLEAVCGDGSRYFTKGNITLIR